ncbi:NTP transferase domain-containing protein [Patescibacteria group bacterium]|nr:NTP transferase domain-containing protein [Patescibacteria group bacterium]
MQAVILAAGRSSRFWPLNQCHKSLIKVMGRPLIWHTIEGLRKTGISEIIIIQGTKAVEEELKKYKIKAKIKYVVQKEPKGTGDAISQAREFIKGPFVVVGPHKVDLENYLPQLLEKFKKNKGKIILTGVKTDRPWDFGIFKLKGDKVLGIVEKPKKGKEPSDIKTTETYIFPQKFFDYYEKTTKKEEDLIDTINLFVKDNGAEFVLLKGETASLKYPWDLFGIAKILFDSKGFKNKIASSAIIGKNVIIEKNVYIGENTKILENTIIRGPSYIGNNCVIGNNSVVRGYTNLEDGILLGALAEIKNSIVQEGSHFHSGYIGDSIFGENCRTGAGIITGNRRIDRHNIKAKVKGKKIDTGLTFFGVVAGDNTRFGVRVSPMPGTLIGSNSIIGPGTLVFENIGDNMVFYARQEIVKKRA